MSPRFMELPVILVCLVLGFTILIAVVKHEISKLKTQNDTAMLMEWIKSTQTTIADTNRTLNEAMRGTSVQMTRTLQENTRQLNERLDAASKVMGDLRENLGEMSEVGKGIKSLQEFLQSPKLRGNIGEQVLSDMIGQTFPKQSFHLQYPFRSGVKVDAVLKTDAGLLCIDSKFPMENFSKMHSGETEAFRTAARRDFLSDVKKHVTDIGRKYILPDEGTMDFALMYIPSESVYYEIANDTELMEFSRRLRVYPVSPNTLYAHLQVLLLSFQGKALEAKTQEVFRLLRSIRNDYRKIGESVSVVNRHVTNAFNGMNALSGTVNVLGQKLDATDRLHETTEMNILPEGEG